MFICNWILWIAVFLISYADSKPPYCLPSDDCWPTSTEISTFSSSLNGQLIQPSDQSYNQYINITQDLLYRNQYPPFIAVPSNVEDIQKSVSFASFHNIQISICSTGHSYSGRNTANNSLQINLRNMRNFKINKNENDIMESITVETGLQWGSIFGLIAPNIIIAPDDQSVGPGGSSLRGGHSPISPAFGLVSDFTLEYYIVDANSDIVHIYNTSGTNETIDNLFWSLKGGGGSTFGVIVNITFKVHIPYPQSKFISVFCAYPFYQKPITKQGYIGDIIFNNLWKSLGSTLDQQWGGYMVVEAVEALLLSVHFYGNVTYAIQNAKDSLFNLSVPYNIGGCSNVTIYNTFQEFETQFKPDTGGSYSQIWNDLVPQSNFTMEYTNDLCSFFNSTNSSSPFTVGMVSMLQGGKVNTFNDNYTAVTPAFRHNKGEMALFVGWSDPNATDVSVKHANVWESKFTKYGLGKYSNEENYDCGSGCNWKYEFYGNHYDKLLKVKQIWDPNQVFWCYHCVGSDQ